MKQRRVLALVAVLFASIVTMELAQAQQPGKIPPPAKVPSFPLPPPKAPTPQLPPTPADFLYTAETNELAKKQGLVRVGNFSWGCQGLRCVAKSTAPTPDVAGCRTLAEQVGQIRSYGYPTKQIGAEELKLCNAGIAGAAGTPTPPVSPGTIPPLSQSPLLPQVQSPEKPPISKLDQPALTALLSPRVSGYSPGRVVAGDTVTVLGSGFSASSPAHVMNIGGEGYGRTLTATSWSPNQVQVRLPADIPPGRYYVGLAESSGRWLSNLERTLEVVDPLRRLPIHLDVRLGCEFDVISSSPSVGIQFTPAGLTLRSTGSRSGPQGSRIYQYESSVEILVGRYGASATDSNFSVDFWDYINGNSIPIPGGHYIERINWEDCYIHRRVTNAGRSLPRPDRQSRRVRLDRDSLNITADISEIRLQAFTTTGTGVSGALPAPTPVMP